MHGRMMWSAFLGATDKPEQAPYFQLLDMKFQLLRTPSNSGNEYEYGPLLGHY